MKAGKRNLPKDAPEQPVFDLAFSPDSQALFQVEYGRRNVCRMWDLATNRSKEVGKREPLSGESWGGLSPAGTVFLASAGGGKSVQLLDLKRNQLIGTWPAADGRFLRALAPDGSLAATTLSTNGSRPLTVFDTRTGAKHYRIDFNESSTSLGVAFSRDNSRLYVGKNDGITIHDLVLRRQIATLGGDPPPAAKPKAKGPADPFDIDRVDIDRDRKRQKEERRKLQEQGYHVSVEKLIVSGDGKRLVSLGEDVRVWDVAANRQCRIIPWKPAAYAFSNLPAGLAPDNRRLAVGKSRDQSGGAIGIVDIFSGQELHTFKGHLGAVNRVVFSNDGKLLASASEDTTTLLWDATVISPRPAKALKDDEQALCWGSLSGRDPSAAAVALARLIDDPTGSIRFAKQQFAKEKPFLWPTIERLIANLDSDTFAVREEASRDLAKLNWDAEPAMRKAMASTPSPEVRHRLSRLLEQLPAEQFYPAVVFASRVTEILEHIGTPEAREVLSELAKGPRQDRLAQEADASLARLNAKSGTRR